MALFSKRHYLAASAALRAGLAGEGKSFCVLFLCDLFARDNSQFNRARFVYDAGGLYSGVSAEVSRDASR